MSNEPQTSPTQTYNNILNMNNKTRNLVRGDKHNPQVKTLVLN